MKKVLVPLADGCEELEAITLTDILVRAGLTVVTAGLKEGIVTASRGAKLMPDTTLALIKDETFDCIALPGGLPGANHLTNDSTLRTMIQHQNNGQHLLAAICAGPRALASAGVLNHRTITCYPGSLDDLKGHWTISQQAIEKDHHIITGRGPGVALDFALFLAEQLVGKDTKDRVEKALVR